MEKFCPKCGKKVSANAKFCSHCGYNFALRNSNQPTKTHNRVQAKSRQKKKKGKAGLSAIFILVLLVLAGGGYYYWHQGQASQTEESSNNYSKRQRKHESVTESHSSSSRQNVDHTKLSTDLGPKGSAAAVTYYAAKNDIDGWQSMADSDDLKVNLSTSDDLLGSLSATGMAYVVSSDSKSGDRMLVYTIDKDDTINIYSLPDDYDSDSTYDPVKSIAKSDMIDSINSNHYAARVKSLQDRVTINQEDEN